MRAKTFLRLALFLAASGPLAAQPFLQLLPRGFYKEDAAFTGQDWAGFYRTSQYDEIGNSLMLLIPAGDTVAGFVISEDLRYIRILQGPMKGNGVNYVYATLDSLNKLKIPNPAGEGVMVMKDDPKRESVYCKHGHASGIGEQKGCFTAGKKSPIALKNGDQTGDHDWSGDWKMDADYDNAIMHLEKVDAAYIGYYTLKDFQKSYSATSGWAMGFNKTTTTTYTFPESTVGILGLPYGDSLYFLYIHRDGEAMGAGSVTMSADRTGFTGATIAYDKVKKLGQKGSQVLNCKR